MLGQEKCEQIDRETAVLGMYLCETCLVADIAIDGDDATRSPSLKSSCQVESSQDHSVIFQLGVCQPW